MVSKQKTKVHSPSLLSSLSLQRTIPFKLALLRNDTPWAANLKPSSVILQQAVAMYPY